VVVKLQVVKMDHSEAHRKRKRDEMSAVADPAEPLLIGGYSNESNPFGDSNLSSAFEWKLKKDKMMKQGVNPVADSKEAERRRTQELQVRKALFSFLVMGFFFPCPLVIPGFVI
jgi:hypothetical protein